MLCGRPRCAGRRSDHNGACRTEGHKGVLECHDALRTTMVRREAFRPQRHLQASRTAVHHCMSLSSMISTTTGYFWTVKHY